MKLISQSGSANEKRLFSTGIQSNTVSLHELAFIDRLSAFATKLFYEFSIGIVVKNVLRSIAVNNIDITIGADSRFGRVVRHFAVVGIKFYRVIKFQQNLAIQISFDDAPTGVS